MSDWSGQHQPEEELGVCGLPGAREVRVPQDVRRRHGRPDQEEVLETGRGGDEILEMLPCNNNINRNNNNTAKRRAQLIIF